MSIKETQPNHATITPLRRNAHRATDLLLSIYQHPGPYTTVYLATRPLMAMPDTYDRWKELRADLETQCAPLDALKAIEARLGLPGPDDAAAIAVIAAADGATVVDYGLEPPANDYGVVDELPHSGPLMEWSQRTIPHLVVTVDDDGADIALFGANHYERLDTIQGNGPGLVGHIRDRQLEIAARLILVVGSTSMAGALADQIRLAVPMECRIVIESSDTTPEDLADATVRHVADTTARATVRLLRERRFLDAHDAAVDGAAETVEALALGSADILLVHDDPDDQRRCWIGKRPFDLSLDITRRTDRQARLVDAVIWSALRQGVAVHIIPSTGPTGPRDNTAAITKNFDIGPGQRVGAESVPA